MMQGRKNIFVLACYSLFLTVTAICDRYTGPQGTTNSECMRFKKFNYVPQLATCLSSKYINETSKGRSHCTGDDTYCWYPCMCDLHRQCSGGSVYTDCACDPNEPATDKMSDVSSILPLSCFEPHARDCSWYKYCFRQKYPCEDMDEVLNAISFDEKFCELYSDHYHSFSFGTRLWMDQTKMCHTSALLPLLSTAKELTTCNQVATRASDSNIRCMTIALYACALNWTEKLMIFWTLIGSERMTFADQMRQVWEVFSTSNHINPVSERLPLEFSNISSIELLVQSKITARNHMTAAKITDELAVKRHWSKRGLAWFGYNTGSDITAHKTQNNRYTQINIRILLAPKQQYDLNAPDAPDVNMTDMHEVMALGNAVRDRLQLTVDDAVVDVVSMTACSDVDCKLRYLYVKARPKKPISPGRTSNVGHVFTASIWYNFVGATIISLIRKNF